MYMSTIFLLLMSSQFAMAVNTDVSNTLHDGKLRLLSAYYIPDPKPPEDSNQVEGLAKPAANGAIFKPLQNLYKDHAEFGGVRILVQNNSDSVIHLEKIRLNGKPIEESYVDFLDGKWDDRGVVWYRVRPKVLAPEQISEIYIRFRRRPEGSFATVAVDTKEGDSIEAVFTYSSPGISIDYVTSDADLHKLYVYTRRYDASAGNLATFILDGKLIDTPDIYGRNFPGNISLTIIESPIPFNVGDFHTVQVTTDTGRTVAAQFRVLPFFFMRTGFHWNPKSAEEVRDVSMNMVWNAMPFEQADSLGVYTANLFSNFTGTKINSEILRNHRKNLHPRMRYYYLLDEPDAKDVHPDFKKKHDAEVRELGPLFTGLGAAVGLGLHARQMVDQIEEIEQMLYPVATYLVVDGTTRPLNWFVYGQLADIVATDPYPVNFYGADWTTIREQYDLIRQASAPRPFHACLEAYSEQYSRKTNDPNVIRRAPSSMEFRQMAIQALGCGAKGISSWLWGKLGGMTGADYRPDIRREYIRINKLTEYIETELLLGSPIDIVTNDAGLTVAGSWYYLEETPYKLKKPWLKDRVCTRALLCGPDAILVTAVNHIPASRVKPEQVVASSNVKITVQLPEFLGKVKCFEVDDSGLHPYGCIIKEGKAVINLDSIESGRIFLLRREK